MLLLAGVLLACSEVRNGAGPISQRIGEQVRTPGAREVDLRQLPSFGWDIVHVSRPGMSREAVCDMIGATRKQCGRIIRLERAPADHVYLLFGLNGQLTHIELHDLANGDFDLAMPASGLPKAQAVFRIRRSTSAAGAERIRLEPR